MRRIRNFIMTLLFAGLMVVTSVFSVSCCHHRVVSNLLPTIPEQVMEHFITIEADQGGDQTPVASGVYVEVDNKPYMLTAAHVWTIMNVVAEDECVALCHDDVCICANSDLTSCKSLASSVFFKLP